MSCWRKHPCVTPSHKHNIHAIYMYMYILFSPLSGGQSFAVLVTEYFWIHTAFTDAKTGCNLGKNLSNALPAPIQSTLRRCLLAQGRHRQLSGDECWASADISAYYIPSRRGPPRLWPNHLYTPLERFRADANCSWHPVNSCRGGRSSARSC